MSNKIITPDGVKEFISKAKEKNYANTIDYTEADTDDLDALFPALDEELSMADWMKTNCADYATATYVPNDFYLEAATHKVTSLKNAFAGCAALTDIAQFETRNVTDFTGMFTGCTALPSVLEFVFQCDSITDLAQLAGMFSGCSVRTAKLDNLDLSLAAKLIPSPAQLGDLDAVIIDGYYIKVVKTS